MTYIIQYRHVMHWLIIIYIYTLLTKTTDAQNDFALSYHIVRGLYFLAVVFTATIASMILEFWHCSSYYYHTNVILGYKNHYCGLHIRGVYEKGNYLYTHSVNGFINLVL